MASFSDRQYIYYSFSGKCYMELGKFFKKYNTFSENATYHRACARHIFSLSRKGMMPGMVDALFCCRQGGCFPMVMDSQSTCNLNMF